MPVLGGYQIQVTFRGATGAFSKIAGIKSENLVLDSNSTTVPAPPFTAKVPGKYSCSQVVFSAGYMIPLQAGGGWWNNVEGVQRGDVGAHEECRIEFYAANNPAPVLIVNLVNAWPSKWTAGDMSAAKNILWAETIIMQCEGVDFSWDTGGGG
jgi:T4-like virus tail tube protein gp19